MTPTLLGRWETRLLLLATVGVVVTIIVGLLVHNFATPFAVLGYVFLFGVVWDIFYQATINYRWDRDWPTVFQVLAGIVEGALVWFLAHAGLLPGVAPAKLPFGVFIGMYATIWVLTFMIAQGPLRLFLVRWRYQGGEVV